MPADPRPSTTPATSSEAPARPSGARGRWPLRDYPALAWMVLAVAMTLVHPFVPDSRWLMVHLVLLGAVTHSIMVWSTHFSQALLRSAPTVDDRRQQSRRLVLLLVGTCLTLVGVPTATWWLTAAGASLVVIAVLWHAVQLVRRLRASLPGRFRVTVRYYLAAAACLAVGVGVGATLAFGLDEATHGRLLLAHVSVNVLGWVGLTVTGTLLTLWPTMLRTPIGPRAERRAQQALPGLAGAVLLLVAGALADLRWVSVAALTLYALALLWWASAVLAPAWGRPPREFAPASVGLSLLWWLAGIVVTLARLAEADSWAEFADGFGTTSAILVVGFAAQLVPGALSYLVPSVLGGGKTVVRAGAAWFDRWASARLVVVNIGLLLCLLPVPSIVRVVLSVLVVTALATFVPLMVGGIRASARARREVEASRAGGSAHAGGPARAGTMAVPGGPDRLPSIWSGQQVAAAVSVLALGVSVGLALDPAAVGSASPGLSAAGAEVPPTGRTTTVDVVARGMRFDPARIEVPAGDRLVVTLTNADADVHDLQLLGQRTPRLRSGESATLDLGVVGASAQGWCTIVGHRQQGMVLDVVALGTASTDASSIHDGGADHGDTTARPPEVIDPAAHVMTPVDPVLPPLTTGPDTTHRLTLRATEQELEVAPGITQVRWTFNGQVPGPTLRGRVGDTFEVTLVNDGSIGHSLDFHAGALAPDEPMRTIGPGESLVYRFTARRAGIWMYHCSTMPMSAHIAAGMHGAVIIEPEDGLPTVDREYLLVQSEVHLEPRTGREGVPATEVDADSLAREDPTFVAFNGIANQYDEHMLTARVGERVRVWVLAAGPNRGTSFHIVGGQFDTTYAEGAYLLGGPGGADQAAGSQALGLFPAQGGFVELTFPEAGRYPLVSHAMVDAERGAHGFVRVSR